MSYGKLLHTSSFKRLFPKTFLYLELIVPLIYPENFKPNSSLPDIKVNFYPECKDGSSRAFFSYAQKFFSENPFIGINISNMLSHSGHFLKNPSELKTPDVFRKLVNYFDSIPRYRSILIHEYIHFIDHKYNLMKYYKVPKQISELSEKDCIPLAKKLVFEHHISESVNKHLSEYIFKDIEIQARLASWIFLHIKGHNFSSIKSLESHIFGKYYFKNMQERHELTKSLYEEAKRKLVHEEKQLLIFRKKKAVGEYMKSRIEIKRLKEEIKHLHKRIAYLVKIKSYAHSMEKEVIRITNKFKEKYEHVVV